jgi:Outer membrane protein beta-barrel domain
MKSKIMCTVVACLMAHVAFSQPKKTSFADRLFFPFSFGYNVPILRSQNDLKVDYIFSSSVEYRFKKYDGAFVKFNYDVLNNQYYYEDTTKLNTNVSEGKLSANILVLGTGYRKYLSEKWAIIASGQAGIVLFSYPIIPQNTAYLQVKSKSETGFSVRSGMGVEYYIAANMAINFEAMYYYAPVTFIQDKDYHVLAFKLGLVATFF